MDSKTARDLLIEFAEAYQVAQAGGVGKERQAELVSRLVGSTRVILRELLGREPMEEEIDDVLPV